MDKILILKGEKVVTGGIKVEDKKNDFVSVGKLGEKKSEPGRPDNPNTYSLPYLDIRTY